MSKLGPVTLYESNQSNKEPETVFPLETLFKHPNIIDRRSVVTTPFAHLWGKITFQILSHAWGINRTAFHSHKCWILPTVLMQGVLLVNYTCDHPQYQTITGERPLISKLGPKSVPIVITNSIFNVLLEVAMRTDHKNLWEKCPTFLPSSSNRFAATSCIRLNPQIEHFHNCHVSFLYLFCFTLSASTGLPQGTCIAETNRLDA